MGPTHDDARIHNPHHPSRYKTDVEEAIEDLPIQRKVEMYQDLQRQVRGPMDASRGACVRPQFKLTAPCSLGPGGAAQGA